MPLSHNAFCLLASFFLHSLLAASRTCRALVLQLSPASEQLQRKGCIENEPRCHKPVSCSLQVRFAALLSSALRNLKMRGKRSARPLSSRHSSVLPYPVHPFPGMLPDAPRCAQLLIRTKAP